MDGTEKRTAHGGSLIEKESRLDWVLGEEYQGIEHIFRTETQKTHLLLALEPQT